MNRRSFSVQSLALFLPAFLGLAACGPVSPLITQSTGYVGPTGEGTVGTATTVNEKCMAIWTWFKKLEKEKFYLDLRYGRSRDLAEAANLFRKDEFLPVFGFAYTQENAAEIKKINQKIMPFCYGRLKGASPEITQNFKSFFPRGIPFNHHLASQALSRTVIAQGRDNLLANLSSVPATPQGFTTIETEYLSWANNRGKKLWPSEQEKFLKAVHLRRAQIAQKILTDMIPDPAKVPPSLTGARKIRQADRYIDALFASGDEPQRILAQSYRDRVYEIVAGLVKERVKELNAIPISEEGFRLSEEWIHSFNRAFWPAYSQIREVEEAREAFVQKRDALFRANQKTIYEKFSSLGYGLPAVKKEQALFRETFPVGLDTDTDFYREFQQQHRKKRESVVLELLKKGAISAQEYYETVSGWARDFIHGSPE